VKKVAMISAALMVMLSVLTAGCGNGSGVGATIKSGDLVITLDHVCWIGEYGTSSWDNDLFWLVASCKVKNDGESNHNLSYDDIYLITAEGKVYENSEIKYGWEPYGYWRFESKEVKSVDHMWYFSVQEPEDRAEFEELKESQGVKLVVDRAEFDLPQLETLELMSAQQYYVKYGRTPPPMLRHRG